MVVARDWWWWRKGKQVRWWCPLCPGLGSYSELFPECYLGQGWTLCRQWGVTTRWCRVAAPMVSPSLLFGALISWHFTMRHKLQMLLQQILAIFTLGSDQPFVKPEHRPDPGSKLHLHMWVYHIKSLLTRPLRVLNPCFPMLNKIAKFLHHFLQLRHRNPPRKSAAFCRYISNISDKLMRVVERELFNFDID